MIEMHDVNENNDPQRPGFVQSRKWFQDVARILQPLCNQESINVRLKEGVSTDSTNDSTKLAALSTPGLRAAFPQIHDGHVLEITHKVPDQKATKTRLRITPGGVKLDSGALTADTVRLMAEAFKRIATPEEIILQQKEAGKAFVIVAPSKEWAEAIRRALGDEYKNLIDSIEIRSETGKPKKMTSEEFDELLKQKSKAKPAEELSSDSSAQNTGALAQTPAVLDPTDLADLDGKKDVELTATTPTPQVVPDSNSGDNLVLPRGPGSGNG